MDIVRPENNHILVSDADIAEGLDFLREPAPHCSDVPAIVGFDLETSGLDPRRDVLCLMQLSNAEANFAIPYKDVSEHAKGLIRDYLSDHTSRPPLVAHNANFEWRFCMANGIEISDGLLDTLVLEQILMAGMDCEVGLEETIARRIKQSMPKYQQTAYWLAHHSKYRPQMWEYALADSAALVVLYPKHYKLLKRDRLLQIAELEMACVIPYARMGWAGIHIDKEGLEALAAEKQREAEDLLPKVVEALSVRRAEVGLQPYQPLLQLGSEFAATDLGFSLTSPTELGRELVRLGVPLEETEKSKKEPDKQAVYITDKTALKGCSVEFPFVGVIAEYSAAASEAQDARKILGVIHPKTGRCHPEFQQNRCETGRSSTKNPNSQNIPRGKHFRNKFIPGLPTARKKRRVFVNADYGQVELKVVTQITGDPKMVETYNDPNGDLHRRTASICMKVPEQDVTGEQRRGAKSINFGLCFGMKPRKLRWTAFEQYNYRMSEEESLLFHERYFTEYAGVAAWHERIERAIQRGDYTQVISLGGRRRILPVEDRRLQLVANSQVQTVAANIAKLAISRLDAAFKDIGIESAILINVIHDELIVEVDEDEAEVCKDVVSAVMEDAEAEVLTSVPPEAEAKICQSWADK